VRTQRSRIGRRRKVFKQGKAHISFTGKAVTSSAGMAVVSRAFDAFSIRDQLDRIFRSSDKVKKYPTSTFLQQLVALRILGGEAISDAAILDETAIKAMFGWGAIAHPTTFARRLKALTWRNNLALETIEEIKNDYAATGIRTNDFWANDALFQTGLIAYNLLNCVRRLALPKGLRTAWIKRIGLLLLHMPANVVCRSRMLSSR
jgi:hypothetical protein